MRVFPLYPSGETYRCIDYLLLGQWNKMDDVNTLIDAGGGEKLIDDISVFNTGVGKKAVEQVILTHNHFDHTSALKKIIDRWSPRVYSFAQTPYTTHLIENHQVIKVANTELIAYHTPLHSHDSICLWSKKHGVLFSGDVILNIKSPGGSYPRKYVDFIDQLLMLDIKAIYSGHDRPVTEHIYEMLLVTMKNILLSDITD